MRKYHQAGLAIIATLSLVALLFYRHEYNKLRYVLEVFNYFGRPVEANGKNCSCNLAAASAEFSTSTDRFDDPIPSWQRLNDQVYIYSAYAISDEEIRAIGFAKIKRLSSLSCKVLYENSVEPVAGDFSYKTIEFSESIDRNKDSESATSNKGIWRAYDLICKHGKSEKKLVAGVIFATTQATARSKSSFETMLSVRKLETRAIEERNEIGICVAPSASRPILNADMINFISFHNSIGIDRFVIYDFGIPQRLNNIFKHISKQSSAEFNLKYATVPWNFPFPQIPADVAKRVVQADCLYRLYNEVKFAMTLTWDEYIIMKYHRALEKLFQDIDKTGFVGQRYGLLTTNVCVEDRDNENSKITILGDGKIREDRPIYVYRAITNVSVFNEDDIKTREITPEIVVVNKYERHCNRSSDSRLNVVDDPHVGPFSASLETSPIYKLFRLYI